MTCLREGFNLKVTQVCHKRAKTKIKQIHGSLILTPPVTLWRATACLYPGPGPGQAVLGIKSFRSAGKVRLIGGGVRVSDNFPVAGL